MSAAGPVRRLTREEACALVREMAARDGEEFVVVLVERSVEDAAREHSDVVADQRRQIKELEEKLAGANARAARMDEEATRARGEAATWRDGHASAVEQGRAAKELADRLGVDIDRVRRHVGEAAFKEVVGR